MFLATVLCWFRVGSYSGITPYICISLSILSILEAMDESGYINPLVSHQKKVEVNVKLELPELGWNRFRVDPLAKATHTQLMQSIHAEIREEKSAIKEEPNNTAWYRGPRRTPLFVR